MRIFKPKGKGIEKGSHGSVILTKETTESMGLRPLPIPARIEEIDTRNYDAVLGLGHQFYFCKKIGDDYQVQRTLHLRDEKR